MNERIKLLQVNVEEGESGSLEKSHRFTFAYEHRASTNKQIALSMPVRLPSYSRGAIPPIFEQNIPEGFVRERIIERLQKHIRVDEMLFLALQKNFGIGRIGFTSDQFPQEDVKKENLAEILQWQGKQSLFEDLVDKYLLQTSISGVQPKVLIRDQRATFHTPGLIVKSGLDEYPGLAVNEFVCMSAALKCGLAVPKFYLSNDHKLFIMHRFDLTSDGKRIGLEDFSVLLGESTRDKYSGSYESLARVIEMYSASPRRDMEIFFRILVLSTLVGNGDAHKKNFSLIYDDIQAPETIRLAPAYDIISTLPYFKDDTPALKMNGNKKRFPSQKELQRFGKKLGIKKTGDIIEQFAQTVIDTLAEYKELLEELPQIKKGIRSSVSRCMARTGQ
jgi:serine/threonine-protein kinase HipA